MLMGCELPERNTQVKSIKIGVTLYDQYDAFLSELMEDFNTYAAAKEEETGIAINVEVYNASQSQATQNNQVEAMAQDGCDIICVNLVDRTDPTTVIDLAEKNDIPVIFFNREPVPGDLSQWNQLYYVGCEAKQSGEMQGEIAADYIKNHPEVDRNQDGRIQYILLEGEAGHQDAISRTEYSVKTLMKKDVILEKLSYQLADWNRGQAENRMNRLISQYGKKIELVMSNNDEMALGAVEAYRKAGYVREEWPVIFGIDGLEEALEAVKAGEMQGSILNDRVDQAKKMAKMAVELFEGEEFDQESLKEGRYYFSEYQKVDGSNIDEYLNAEETISHSEM
jgi:methyl-galactoside transport system substrate-binding protein